MKLFLILLFATAISAETGNPRHLLLADVPLAELASDEAFAKAVAAAQAGDTATARKELLAATASRETRIQLLAWNALRNLGVQPEAEQAWIVRGVVVESHDAAVAVYEDGRARWLDANGSGAHDAPGSNKEVARHIRTMLTSAETAMKSTRPMPRADSTPVSKDRVRLTVLTYAGFYVIDVHGSAIDEAHPIHAPLRAATEIHRLLHANGA